MAVLQRSDIKRCGVLHFFGCFGWIILLGSQEPHRKVEADAEDVELGQLGKDAISDGSSRDSCESRERLLTTRTAND